MMLKLIRFIGFLVVGALCIGTGESNNFAKLNLDIPEILEISKVSVKQSTGTSQACNTSIVISYFPPYSYTLNGNCLPSVQDCSDPTVGGVVIGYCTQPQVCCYIAAPVPTLPPSATTLPTIPTLSTLFTLPATWATIPPILTNTPGPLPAIPTLPPLPSGSIYIKHDDSNSRPNLSNKSPFSTINQSRPPRSVEEILSNQKILSNMTTSNVSIPSSISLPTSSPTVNLPEITVSTVTAPSVNNIPNISIPSQTATTTSGPIHENITTNETNTNLPSLPSNSSEETGNHIIGITIIAIDDSNNGNNSNESLNGNPPSPDLVQSIPICRSVTTKIQSIFKNPSYPLPDQLPTICQHIVIPTNGTCAIRYDFVDVILAGKLGDTCNTDNIQIINSDDTPTSPQCGLLSGYQITVKATTSTPVTMLVTTQSPATLWNIKVTQIRCSKIKSVKDLEPEFCGKKGSKKSKRKFTRKEITKTISASRLLKTKTDPLRDVYNTPSAPTNLLQKLLLRSSPSQDIKIVKGNETGVNEWPWQAFIMIDGRPLCGGSLINHEWIITAGHCASLTLRFPLSSLMIVDLGDHDLRTMGDTPESKIYHVSKIVPHVQHQSLFYDVALIKLASRVEFTKAISPICLPYPELPEPNFIGRTAVTTGWGKTESSIISPVLRQAEIKIISNEDCRGLWELVGEGGGDMIESYMICAGGGEIGPCNGDSGGPLVLLDLNDKNKWQLVGLTSFGSLRGCALPGVPTVFTRITSFLEWITINISDS